VRGEVQHLQRIAVHNQSGLRALALSLAVAALAGCGSEPSRAVPVECKQASRALERALARAPGDVRIGGRRISDCFTPGSDAADLQELGGTLLPVAARLAVDARAHPRGPAPMRLGFVIGAVRRGTAQGGVYAELERRLEQELTGVDTSAPGFVRGSRAGRAHG
jgi:hypothetical protein